MKAVKKYSSGGKVKSGCGCGKKGCNCKAKSYADGGFIDAIRKLLGKDKVNSAGVDYSKDCGVGVSCGDSFEVGSFKSKAATSGSNKKRLGASVGSSKAFRQKKRDEKKEERKGHRAVKKAARQENRAERQSEKDKKKRTYKYANPRFL
tara:strand:+ start:1708 stop:2154 length:447 start_codon:yes stop_codon:yes gene_type:complete